MKPLLSIQGITKTYSNNYRALRDINLDVMPGEFLTLLGPSGCGKTTLLTTIAGFLHPDSGRIVYDDVDITYLPAHRRQLNTVFQSYALFPHMSIEKNVMYGPQRTGMAKAEAKQRAHEALALVGLEGFEMRMPAELSGGQRQRVALARAIVNKPKLLLLDEPLSALDLKLRKRMQMELKALQEKLAISFIFVTHDQEEALAMSDRIVVMNQGDIEQIGTGDEVYSQPATRFVGEFIGDVNIFPVRHHDGKRWLSLTNQELQQGDIHTQEVLVRPEHVHISLDAADGLAVQVKEIVNVGSHCMFFLEAGEFTVMARSMGSNNLQLQCEQTVFMRIDVSKACPLEA